MALMRILNRMESDGWQEVRDGPMVKVTRVSPSTCSLFPLLPRENATGNWVKVVQRVPVRLQLTHVDAEFLLQSGLSADVTVDTHSLDTALSGAIRPNSAGMVPR